MCGAESAGATTRWHAHALGKRGGWRGHAGQSLDGKGSRVRAQLDVCRDAHVTGMCDASESAYWLLAVHERTSMNALVVSARSTGSWNQIVAGTDSGHGCDAC